MKKIFVLLLLISSLAQAQPVKLSEQARISVITCGPWQGELYSAFGHSAFRVYDPAQGINEAYNYGIFDFDQPNFYLNFARGFMYYQLGVYDYDRFRDHYISYNRSIHEQVLNLTPAQQQKLYDYLQWNALPENVGYRYDYFFDNCATKMPGVVLKAIGDSVVFDGSYITTDYSIRELTDIYLSQQPWGDLGIDICLGSEIDKPATPYQYMFLPDYVETGFEHATIAHGQEKLPLVKQKIIVYESRDEDPAKGLPHPAYLFSAFALLVIMVTAWDWKRRKVSTWLDILILTATGAIGLLLLFLWFATDHKSSYNFNLLWALPTNLVAAVALAGKRSWLKRYFLIVLIIQVVVLLAWPVLPQKLNLSLLPLVIAIAVRAAAQWKLGVFKER
jgi:hypothetical protein